MGDSADDIEALASAYCDQLLGVNSEMIGYDAALGDALFQQLFPPDHKQLFQNTQRRQPHMNLKSLRPVSELAKKSGEKIILYGPPGTGKTPMIAKLKNAMMVCIENGLSSVRNDSILAWEAYEMKHINEFFEWAVHPSKEIYKFDTIIIDSITKLCDVVLKDAQSKTNHGQKAYGDMAKYVEGFVNTLCFMPNMNVIFTAQMATEEIPIPGQPFATEMRTFKYNRPLFPGKVLDKKVNHDINEIWYAHKCLRPDGTYGNAIATTDTGIALCRSRCGLLDPLEPCDLNYLFSKINVKNK